MKYFFVLLFGMSMILPAHCSHKSFFNYQWSDMQSIYRATFVEGGRSVVDLNGVEVARVHKDDGRVVISISNTPTPAWNVMAESKGATRAFAFSDISFEGMDGHEIIVTGRGSHGSALALLFAASRLSSEKNKHKVVLFGMPLLDKELLTSIFSKKVNKNDVLLFEEYKFLSARPYWPGLLVEILPSNAVRDRWFSARRELIYATLGLSIAVIAGRNGGMDKVWHLLHSTFASSQAIHAYSRSPEKEYLIAASFLSGIIAGYSWWPSYRGGSCTPSQDSVRKSFMRFVTAYECDKKGRKSGHLGLVEAIRKSLLKED